MDVAQFMNVEELKQESTVRASLWRSLHQWDELKNGWVNSAFESIDVDEISYKSEMYTKIVMRCERGLPEYSTAVKKLKQMVFEFKETMPIVTALGNRSLKGYHWEEIKQTLKVEYPMENMDFTLGTLINWNVAIY
jgi:dynein heavy chain